MKPVIFLNSQAHDQSFCQPSPSKQATAYLYHCIFYSYSVPKMNIAVIWICLVNAVHTWKIPIESHFIKTYHNWKSCLLLRLWQWHFVDDGTGKVSPSHYSQPVNGEIAVLIRPQHSTSIRASVPLSCFCIHRTRLTRESFSLGTASGS